MSRSPEQLSELINELRAENERRNIHQTEERKLFREQLIRERELSRMEAVDRETRVFLTLAKVKPYSGNKNPSKIREFKTEIQRISEGFNLDNQQLITVAGRNMQGKAERWFHEYIKDEKNQTSTFDQFIRAMEAYFGEGYDSQWHHARLLELVQKGSVEKFNSRYDELLGNLPSTYLPEEVKINTYLTQLKHHIRREVKCKNPTTLREAQRLAMIYDDQYSSDSYGIKYSFRKPKDRYVPREESQSDKMEIDLIMRKPKVCYNCGKEGHFATNCSNKSKN